MNRKTTTIRNIVNILCHDPMAQIVKAEYCNHPLIIPNKENIDASTMLESLSSLEENVVFSNIIDWTYENVSDMSDMEDFIIYGALRDSLDETVVVIHLRLADGHTIEHVENELDKKYLLNIQNIANLKENI